MRRSSATAYGRQIDSAILSKETSLPGGPLEMVYIRAPRITRVGDLVEVLADRDGFPVLVRQGTLMAATFHPELSTDRRVHQLFVDLVRESLRDRRSEREGGRRSTAAPLTRGFVIVPSAQPVFPQEFPNDSFLWMPRNGALHGFALDRLMQWNLAAIAALFLLALVVLAIALLRRHRTERNRNFGVAGWLPLTLICGLYIWMAGQPPNNLWAANRFEGPSPKAMQVEVVGVQFQWYFRYPGDDATFGATKPQLVNAGAGNPLGIDPSDSDGNDDIVSSELVLPVGREVDIRLRAHDVIHGFFIPGMRLKLKCRAWPDPAYPLHSSKAGRTPDSLHPGLRPRPRSHAGAVEGGFRRGVRFVVGEA